jgi:hypothetical protein
MRGPAVSFIFRIVALSVSTLFLVTSIYGVWGWTTLNDIRKYCEANQLDYHEVVDGMIADVSVSIKDHPGGEVSTQIETKTTKEPIFKWVIPFSLVFDASNTGTRDGKTHGLSYFQGGVLEPLLVLSENTANGLFSLAIGCLISMVVVISEVLKGKGISNTRLILRPIAGSLGSLCTYLIILSGGSIIWNGVAGVSGLSIGLMSAIGAIYVEKLPRYATFTI